MTLNLLKHFNSPLINTLDWDTFQETFAGFSHFSINKNYLKTNDSFNNLDSLNNHYEEIKVVSNEINDENLYQNKTFKFIDSSSEKIRSLLTELKKGQFLELKSLNILFNILETKEQSDRSINALISEFRLICEKDGTDRIESHPKLKKISSDINHIENTLRDQLAKKERAIGYDIIFERFCLMVPSDQYQKNDGSILAHSKTGNTLYVEPFEVKLTNEKRITLIAERDQILFILLRDIGQKLEPHQNSIYNCLYDLEALDLKISTICFNRHYELSIPQVHDEKINNFDNLFHPLIKNPIKNTFSLENRRNLVISGANTGGKTVLLKSITLCALFLKKGLGVPAADVQMNFPSQVFFYSQDGQNIKEGLSSFSSEVEFYVNILNEINDNSLVVIDEIFNSTSSDEASVLAYAFFQKFNDLKCILYSSTHHKNLKELIDHDKNFNSASMTFDIKTLAPTYKINLNSTDSSHALDIFERVAKTSPYFSELKSIAYKNLSKDFIKYDTALRDLSILHSDLSKEKEKFKILNQDLNSKINDIDGSLSLRKQKKIDELNNEIEKIKKQALTILDQVKQGEKNNQSKVEHEFYKLIRPKEDIRKEYNGLQKPNEFIIGKKYFNSKLNQDVVLVSLQGNKARVNSPLGTINCQAQDLYKSSSKKSKPAVQNQFSKIDLTNDSKLEYDCRGMRLEEFEHLIEKVLSDLLLEENPFTNIIHGHGILKTWLVKKIGQEKDFTLKPGPEGNDGISVICLS